MPELIVRKWDGPYSYMVFFERGFYKARRGDTAEIPFEDPSASVVIQQAVNSLLQGGTIFLREVQLPADVTFGSNILIVEDYQGERKFYSNNKEYRSTEETASYIIFIEDGVVKAKNGHTGQVEFSDADAFTVVYSAYNALPNRGGIIKFKREAYDMGSNTLPVTDRQVILRGEGSGTALKFDGDITALNINHSSVVIEDLTIEQKTPTQGKAIVTGANAHFLLLKNVQIFSFATGIEIAGGFYGNIIHPVVSGGDICIKVASNDHAILGGKLLPTDTGIGLLIDAISVKAYGLTVERAAPVSQTGIKITANGDYAAIHGCYFEGLDVAIDLSENPGGVSIITPLFSGCNTNIAGEGYGTTLIREKTAVRAYRSGTEQTVPSNTWTKVQLNAEEYDVNKEFDPTTNYRFTAKTPGYYLVIGKVEWNVTIADKRHRIAIRKNGADVVMGTFQPSFSDYFANMISDIIKLDAGDYLELWAYQNTGGDLDIRRGTENTYMSIHRLV